MERKLTFNEIPELYEAYRPTYPPAMIEDILRISGIPSEGEILEIGCGTGQATVSFAKRGYSMTCLDIGDKTIDFIREKMKDFPKLQFINGDFETWDFNNATYDLIISGSAFHWIDPVVGYPKVASLLKEKGYFAFFWNMHYSPETLLYQDIQSVYQRVAPEMSRNRPTGSCEERTTKRHQQIDESKCYKPVHVLEYPWEQEYSADDYVKLLDTFSDHRIMDPTTKEILFRDIIEVIEDHGGFITRPYRTTCYIACRR